MDCLEMDRTYSISRDRSCAKLTATAESERTTIAVAT